MSNTEVVAILEPLGLKQNAVKVFAKAAESGFVSYQDLVKILPQRILKTPEELYKTIDWLCLLLKALNIVVLDKKWEKRVTEINTQAKKFNVLESKSEGKNENKSNLEELFDDVNEVLWSKDSLSVYMEEVGKFTVPSRDEEFQLAQLIYEQFDEKARNELIERNLRFAVMVARRYRNRGLDYLDLIQEGNIGLIMAADKFNPNLGNKYVTYAIWWIKQSITRALFNCAQTIRIPVHTREFWNKVMFTSIRLVQKLGREPFAHEIAACLECPVEKVDEALRRMKMTTVYVDDLKPKNDEKNDFSIIEFIPSQSLTPEQILMAKDELKESCRAIKDFILQLKSVSSNRNIDIFCLYYGLYDGNFEGLTYEEIAAKFTITRQRVEQIIGSLFIKLKKSKTSGQTWLENLIKKVKLLENITGESISFS